MNDRQTAQERLKGFYRPASTVKYPPRAYDKIYQQIRKDELARIRKRNAVHSQYLTTAWWRERRAAYCSDHRNPDGQNECSKCGRLDGLELHHIRYFDENGTSILYREQDSDLSLLCRRCRQSHQQD